MGCVKFAAVVKIDAGDVFNRIGSDMGVSVARICFSH
jgi:hypothetical protein